MIIGIDIDDVISDTYEKLFNYAQRYTIEELKKPGKISNENSKTHKYVKSMHGWNDEEEMKFWDEYYEKIMKEVSPKTFAAETIKKLSEDNKIILITARWENSRENIANITKQWLKENNIVYDELVLDSQDKGEIAKRYNIDLFIDDSFKNCKDVSSKGITTFIMDTRFNKAYEDEKIKRVYSWPHIYQEYQNTMKGEI